MAEKRDYYEVRSPDITELDSVQQLRHEVLDPARVHKSDVALSAADFDDKNLHMAAFLGADLVSTLRMDYAADGRYEVVKVATAEAHRRRGLGGRVLTAAERVATAKGATGFFLSSRLEAIPFYAELGYQLDSPEIISPDGVVNRWMKKEV